MKISVVSTSEYSRLNAQLGRTSDGWFYGDKTTYKCYVYIDSKRLSFQDANIIYGFIKKSYGEEHDTRVDGPEEPVLKSDYNEQATKSLIELLGGNNYEASSSFEQFQNALPIAFQMIQTDRKNKLTFIGKRNDALNIFINSLLIAEKEYISRIINNIVNPNDLIEILIPEKIKSIDYLSIWKDELKKFEEQDISNTFSENNIFHAQHSFEMNVGKIYLKPIISDIDKKIESLDKNLVLSLFHHNGYWSAYPIDLAIYINDIVLLKKLLNQGANVFRDTNGMEQICVENKDDIILKHEVFSIENRISNDLVSFLLNVIRNDFIEGLKYIFSKTTDYHKLISFVFCASVQLKSFDIFKYITSVFNINNNLISINFNREQEWFYLDDNDYNYKESKRTIQSTKSIVSQCKRFGLEGFKIISKKDLAYDYYYEFGNLLYFTPLQFVCRYGSIEMIDTIINLDEDINYVNQKRTALDFSFMNQDISVLWDAGIGIEDAREAQREIYQYLIKNGAIRGKFY